MFRFRWSVEEPSIHLERQEAVVGLIHLSSKMIFQLLVPVLWLCFCSVDCSSEAILPDAAAAPPQRISGISRRRSMLDNGVGLTPPMGWNSWNAFHINVNETLIRQTADALVSTGLATLGYTYVNLDDGWGDSKRGSQGNLVGHKQTFPSGMKALADYIHTKGLKFGIYADSGFRTCSGRMPGSLGREEQDAMTFASWGVDYLKYDNCANDGTKPTIRYRAMSQALNKTGRSIYFSMWEWGDMRPALWAREIANSWRTTDDISNTWGSMLNIADLNEVYAPYAGPGGWNDPDMLEVGNRGMKQNEYVVHFSLWAIFKAPLILGCDVRNLTNDALQIIGNEEVIAVNQDSLGVQAPKVRNFGQRDLYAGPLSENRTVILFVNRKPYNSIMTATWDDIGICCPCPDVAVRARGLWEHRTLETTFNGSLTATVPPHSCKMFVLTPL